ncbi:MAG TPA: LuxR C-terminal-related transcriptional regulator [Candidatus Dormibacteraeota bacterium]
MADGLTNREIARRLFISERTADGHLEHLREKLAFANRAQIAAWYVAQRAVPEPVRGHLPRPLTTFVGRRAEIEAVAGALAKARLVTLVGPGGVGKTRLALEVARQQHPAGRAWFVDLASLREQRLVAKTVMAAVGGHEDAAAAPGAAIAALLRDEPALLLLDNCEHLVEACSSLAFEMLVATAQLRILATSREPLQVPGEVRWRMEPMVEAEAVQLFLERARLSRPDPELMHEGDPVVEEVCRRLDRLPLAIELAAARTAQIPVTELRRQVVDRLESLAGAGPGVPERHRTMRAAIEWSYVLLDVDDRHLLARLSMFAGGFDLEAAAAVAEATPAAIAQLVDRSLVVLGTGVGGQGALPPTGDRPPVREREAARRR